MICFTCVTLKLDGWHRKTIGHLFFAASSFVHHFIDITEFKLELQSGNVQYGSKLAIFVPCDLKIWWLNLTNKRTSLPYCIKLYYMFQSHRWIQTVVIVRKLSIRVTIGDVFVVWPWNLMDDLKNKREPLLCCFKLCASFQSHKWTATGVTVRKRTIWVNIGDFFNCVTLKFEGWPFKNKRAPPLNNINLCESFYRHIWTQTGVTVRK